MLEQGFDDERLEGAQFATTVLHIESNSIRKKIKRRFVYSNLEGFCL